MIKLLLISILVFVVNIPFGYWRNNVKKFSKQWILAIHIPVPIIIALRLVSGLGFAWYTYVFMISAFFLGQKLGAVIQKKYSNLWEITSSCLIIDIKRNILCK